MPSDSLMYLARRLLDDDVVWLHMIDEYESVPSRADHGNGLRVRRLPCAWDWRSPWGRGVSAIGETEEQAQGLLAERVRLVAEIDAAPDIGHPQVSVGTPRAAPAVAHVPRQRLALAGRGR